MSPVIQEELFNAKISRRLTTILDFLITQKKEVHAEYSIPILDRLGKIPISRVSTNFPSQPQAPTSTPETKPRESIAMVENTSQATWKRITRSGTKVVSSSKPLVLAKQSSGEEIYDDVLVKHKGVSRQDSKNIPSMVEAAVQPHQDL